MLDWMPIVLFLLVFLYFLLGGVLIFDALERASRGRKVRSAGRPAGAGGEESESPTDGEAVRGTRLEHGFGLSVRAGNTGESSLTHR